MGEFKVQLIDMYAKKGVCSLRIKSDIVKNLVPLKGEGYS